MKLLASKKSGNNERIQVKHWLQVNKSSIQFIFVILMLLVWIPLAIKTGLPRISVLFAGLLVGGAASVLASLLNWDWFFDEKPARSFVKMLGRKGARIFYFIFGGFATSIGIWIVISPMSFLIYSLYFWMKLTHQIK